MKKKETWWENISKKEGKWIKIVSVGIFLIIMQTANRFGNPKKLITILSITKVKPTYRKGLSEYSLNGTSNKGKNNQWYGNIGIKINWRHIVRF